MNEQLLRLYVMQMNFRSDWQPRLRRPLFVGDERGEGVISAAIAVLIMAFLGALMWIGFRTIWEDSEDNIRDQTERIGSDDAE